MQVVQLQTETFLLYLYCSSISVLSTEIFQRFYVNLL